MADIVCGAEEGVRGCSGDIIFEFADKEEDLASCLAVVDIALTRGACFACGALALPMKKLAVYGVVVIHRRRGIVLV